MTSASLVSNIMVPSVMPPPKRRRVPQSIFVAWVQEIVNSRFFQSTGSRKSSSAPTTAATPSGIILAVRLADRRRVPVEDRQDSRE